MDIVAVLPSTRRQHDSIWFIVERLIQSTNFIPVKSTYKAEDYARLYIDEIMRQHGIALSIISDRGAQFTSHLWRSFKKSLGTQVKLSSAFHPNTDGQAEHTIHTLEDMLRACVIDFRGRSDDHLPLLELSYSNSNHSSIGMELFEALYSRRCRSPIRWFEVGESTFLGSEIIHESLENIIVIGIG